ncbi:hypothetical protein GRI38_04220 [Altererythrobacter aurantiacus]|uniref:Uncharacterized protein n=1 Tax=Parapontixanthobacter aurantiacus TaxID=1463599 RepID=A0A844ZBR0_9SPHN|nr:hypothetical protein [Parapontixanthobacter aurantiacus]MXO85228.1 hypothetical protein [Parapontixanthobacter aurantiacus]
MDGTPRFGIHREFGPDVIKAAGSGHPNPKVPIPEPLWRAVAADNDRRLDRVQSAVIRRDGVVAECHDLALSGTLKFAWRRKGGGKKPIPVAPEEWEIDYPFVPFATLGYGEDLGLSSPVPNGWLFVTAASLSDVLGVSGSYHVSGSHEKVGERPIQPSSEKLKALANELDAEGIPIREVKSHHIKDRWKNEDGPRPKVTAITSLMAGLGKGGRPPDTER